MTPVSAFLSRAALALIAGAGIATVAVTLAPGAYYDVVEWRLPAPEMIVGQPSQAMTPGGIVAGLLMAAFVFLVGKEGWEALTRERTGLTGPQAALPALAATGGMAGAALVWLAISAAIETAEEAAGTPGWVVPVGADVVLAYLFARRIFGRGHPALQVLLFVTSLQTVAALVLAGIVSPGGGVLRPMWLVLPLAAAGAGWWFLTRPLVRPDATERTRGRGAAVWPWVALALVAWAGVALSGLPPALGFLPVLPAMPRASRSFGMFAVAEGFLTDPANRAAQALKRPLVAVLFLFGLTHGALDAGALAPTSWVALGALWIGKPLGFLLVGWAATRLGGLAMPRGLEPRDMAVIAGLTAIGFTAPVLAMATALPGGAMQEGARLGLALSALAGPAILLATQPPRRRGALPTDRR